jgi:fructokinase
MSIKMSILCIGEALIDMICTDRGLRLADGVHFLKKPGGAPTNVAAAVAALGGQVKLAAKVGTDPFGDHLVEVLNSFGVDTTHVRRDPGYFTTFAFVSLMEDGERDFYFNRGADGQLRPDEVSEISLQDISIVHFGSATAFLPGPLQASYLELLSRVRREGKMVSFDPNYRHLLYRDDVQAFIQQSLHFIRHCDFFKVSDEEAMLLTGKSSLQEAAEALRHATAATFTITLGKDGTLLSVGDEQLIIPSIPIEPVDTTGAGDAFVGAVLHQLAAGAEHGFEMPDLNDWKQIVSKANRAGARTCAYLGAMEAFRHLNKDILD